MKVVLQDGIKDCGVCCLLSIIRHYGGNMSKEYLREITGTNRSGVSAYKLVEAAEDIGFEAKGVRGDLADIGEENLPCIAHVIINKQYRHFIVIYAIDPKIERVVIMDPAKGKRTLSFSEFRLISSLNFIYLKPIKTMPILIYKKVILNTVKELFYKEKISLIILIVIAFLYFIMQIITAFHFKYLLEFPINYNIYDYVVVFSLYLLIVYIFKAIALMFRNLLLIKLMNKLDALMMFRTYKQILLLPYLYYKNRTTGEVISRVKDLNVVKNYIAQFCCFFIIDFVGFLVFCGLLFIINYTISIITVIGTVLLFLLFIICNKRRKKLIKVNSIREEKINSYMVEALANVDTVKGSHLEKMLYDKFSLKYMSFLESNYTAYIFEESLNFVKGLFSDVMTVLILGIGSYLVIRGDFSLAEMIVYQNIYGYLKGCFDNLLSIFNNFNSFKTSLERIEDLFTVGYENFKGNYYYSMHRALGNIKFCDLNYSLVGRKIFDNLNLEILTGQKILLVGSSGVGKSTLVKVLLRYIDVKFGMVSINDIDINHYHLDIIRNDITYVSSNEVLFNNTIYNNITLEREVMEEDFLKVVNICRIDRIVSNDGLGYKKIVEENGFNFSSGERQRIILARSLLRHSNIYIFDEVFSQIDKGTRYDILNDIMEYLKDKTVILISHNMEYMKCFDRVIKLKEGKIYEC